MAEPRGQAATARVLGLSGDSAPRAAQDGGGVAGPEPDMPEEQPTLVERQFGAVEAGVRAALAVENNTLPLHLRRLQPEGDAERLAAVEATADLREGHTIVTVQAQRLADTAALYQALGARP